MKRLNRGTKILATILFLALTVACYGQDDDSQGCTNASLKGAFGFQITGTNLALGPFAFNGRFTADGNGNLPSGDGIEAFQGFLFDVPFIGTYVVNTDCTGTADILFIRSDAQIHAHLRFTLTHGGKDILFISVDRGTIETGVAQKIGRPPSGD